MDTIQKRVQIITEFIDEGSKEANKRVIETTEQIGNSLKKTTVTQKRDNEGWTQKNKTIKTGIPLVKRFRGEYLSLMFAGMALERVFGGILSTQTSIWGITDLMSATITTVMAPAMEMLLTFLMPIFDFFMNLPEPLQRGIGLFVIFGTIIGTLVTIIGGFLLFISSALLPILEIFGVNITALGSAVLGFASTFLALFGIAVGVAYGIYDAFKTNFMGIKKFWDMTINGIKIAFNGIISVVLGIWNIISGIFTLNGSKIWEGMKQIGKGIKDLFFGLISTIFGFVNVVGIGVLDGILTVFQTILNAGYKVLNFVTGGKKSAPNVKSMFSSLLGSKIPSFQEGGTMPRTGLALVHQGERIIPANSNNQSNGSGSINVTYNVTVSDKREFESMLKQNNAKFVDDLKRIVNI